MSLIPTLSEPAVTLTHRTGVRTCHLRCLQVTQACSSDPPPMDLYYAGSERAQIEKSLGQSAPPALRSGSFSATPPHSDIASAPSLSVVESSVSQPWLVACASVSSFFVSGSVYDSHP